MARFINASTMFGVGCALTFAVPGGAAYAQSTGHIELSAARVGGATRLGNTQVEPPNARGEVRLLWVVTEGWLPPGGINIYRSDNPTKALNDTPIKFDTRILDADGAALINRPVAVTKKIFAPGITNRANVTTLSSKAAFTAFKSEVQRLEAKPGVRGAQIAAEAAKIPEVVSYRNRLLPAKPEGKTTPKTPPTQDDAAASVRIQVMIASLSSYDAALKMGFAFQDKTAVPATAYTYTLKSADASATTLATVEVPAGPGLQPPAPLDVDGVQMGAGSVALHWEPVGAEEEKKLTSVSYNVYRGAEKLNTSPLRIAFQPTKNGTHVAPMTSFIDSSATIGSVTYSVKLVDAFGRESAPATVTVTVKDLRAPGPVGGMVGSASRTTPGAVRLFWKPSDPGAGDIPPAIVNSQIQKTDAVYDLYRADSGGQNEATLNGNTPIAGTPLSNLMGFSGSNPPADLADLTGDEIFTLFPAIEEYLRVNAGANRTLDEKTIAALRGMSFDKIYAQLTPKYGDGIWSELRNLRSYLDTTGTPDKDYQYRIAPCYAVNPIRHGTGAQTATISVPTTAAPATPAGLQAAFQKGTGAFGFQDTTVSVPTLRKQGMVGTISQPSRVPARVVRTLANRPVAHLPLTGGKTASAPKGTPSDTEKNVPMTIAGQVKLIWQPVTFTSKLRYHVYRASATGLFPTVQVASAGAPPAGINLNSIPKISTPQRPAMKNVAQQRLSVGLKYYENYTKVPNQNYTLLATTEDPQFVDTVSTSQRVHYHYRIVPVSRWGVEGGETTDADVMVPATLPPTVPTLLKTEVDESATGGRVKLTMSVNPPQDNVAKYLIFRKPIADANGHTVLNLPTQQVAARGSKFAPPVTVKPNATISLPPARARNLSIKDMTANNSALLKWILDTNGYAKVGEVAAPAPSSSQQDTPITYIDTSGLPRTPYAYEVVAVNSDAIASKPSSPLDATALKVKADAPRTLAGSLDQSGDAGKVVLTWQVPAQEPAAHYVLERAAEKLASSTPSTPHQPGDIKNIQVTMQSPLTYVTIDGNVDANLTTFTDTSVRSGRRYTYRLRAVDGEGLFSDAKQATVIYPALPAAVFNDPAPTHDPASPGGNPLNPRPNPNPGGNPLGNPKPPTKSGSFGDTYFLMDDSVFAVRVEKAEYTVAAYAIDAQNFYYCRPAEKFLLLTLRVKNVTNSPQTFDYQTITATSITSDGAELAVTKNWKALDTGKLANRTVEPKGELVVEGVVTVPAEGAPRRLSFGDDAFSMASERNTVAPLSAAFGGGDTIAPEYEVPDTKAFWPMAYTESSLGGGRYDTQKGTSVYVVSLNVKNVTKQALQIAPSNYTVELYDEDGDKYTAQKDETAPASLAPNGQTTLQWTFVVPKSIKLKSLKARERDSRAYIFPLGAK